MKISVFRRSVKINTTHLGMLHYDFNLYGLFLRDFIWYGIRRTLRELFSRYSFTNTDINN
jgi:hypothetical protein